MCECGNIDEILEIRKSHLKQCREILRIANQELTADEEVEFDGHIQESERLQRMINDIRS